MRDRFWNAAVAFAFIVAGCSGGGGSTTVPQTPGKPGSVGNVRMKLVIPNPPAATNESRRQFVSSATQGVKVTTYASSDTTHSSPLATTVADVSSGSSACVGGAGGRTCTVTLTAPAGSDYFAFVLYDTAPVNGAIPSSAHELGIAGVTQTIAAGTSNTVNAPISAIVAGLSERPVSQIVVGDGTAQTIALMVTPTDFGNQQITAGTSNAPFANPIAVAVAETDGSGHTTISIDGGTPGTSGTLSKASDTVEVLYDGLAKAGYSATVTLSAAAYGGLGASNESLAMGNFTVTNPTIFFTSPAANASAALDTYPEGEHVLMISETGAASGTTYSASGCNSALKLGTVVGTGTSATLLVIGSTATSSTPCTLAVSDGTNSFDVAVTNTLRPTPPPSPTIAEYSTDATAPFGIATGADGNLWFSDLGSTYVDAMTTGGTSVAQVDLTGFSEPFGVSLGPDGNVWVGDDGTNLIAGVTTAGSVTIYPDQTDYESNDPIAGTDGRVWFGESDGNLIGAIEPGTSAPSEFTIPNGSGPNGSTIGSNGQIWFGLLSPASPPGPFGEINTSGSTIDQFADGTNQPPWALATGSDGAVWFTEEGADLGRIDTSGNITEYTVPGSPSLNYITAGPDGSLWFADSGNGAIGRITTGGTIIEYPVPYAGAEPVGITVGPDGNIWFTDYNDGEVGKLVL